MQGNRWKQKLGSANNNWKKKNPNVQVKMIRFGGLQFDNLQNNLQKKPLYKIVEVGSSVRLQWHLGIVDTKYLREYPPF